MRTVEVDVTLRVGEFGGADGNDCVLTATLAGLPRGGVLQVEGADPAALERLRDRCGRRGYHVLAGQPLTVTKAGGRCDGPGPAAEAGQAAGRADPVGYSWSVRAYSADGNQTRLHAGRHSFSVGPAVSFRPDEPLPTAVEHLLAALAADLVSTFASCLRERSVEFDALECRLSGQLDDPLASIGVVGARGSPALSAISGTVYVSAELDEPVLRGAWCAATDRSPLFNTLAPCLALRIDMRAER